MAAKTSGRTPLMAGNWKMNLNHLEAIALVQKLDCSLRDGRHDFEAVEVASCRRSPTSARCRPSSTATGSSCATARRTCRPHDSGAYTGEISGAMLAKLGCTYVTVGHSERREYHAESDEVVERQGQGRLHARPDADPLRR